MLALYLEHAPGAGRELDAAPRCDAADDRDELIVRDAVFSLHPAHRDSVGRLAALDGVDDQRPQIVNPPVHVIEAGVHVVEASVALG